MGIAHCDGWCIIHIHKPEFPIFRYNDFQNDPVANVSGCDHLTPAGSLANRLDLSDPNSTCTFSGIDDMVGHSAYGAIDAKLGILPIIYYFSLMTDLRQDTY